MAKQYLLPLLLLPLVIPTASMAQRYGRPYTIAESPQILLLVKADKNHHYFRPADLRKLPRTAVTEVDPVTNAFHTYEGVALDQLVPSAVLASPGEQIEVEFGSHQTVTIPGNEVGTSVKAVIADTIDRKPLSGDAPYCFVVKFRDRGLQKISNVQTITVRSPK